MSNKAIFLDRDGIVNIEIGRYILSMDEFRLLPSIIPFMQACQQLDFRFILITNQAGIARGLYSHAFVNQCHEKLAGELNQSGLAFDEMYYCPHHPEFGKCLCRKPGSLMLEKALSRFKLDPRQSLMIGDKDRDVEAARAAGVPGFLLPSNPSLSELMQCIQP
jgi:D-glycero-D-manno-heptose 1,7-bisphosphate phosphatase